ncbi:MAG TPA: hypothetical protein H9793_02645 [Candidatus Brevibacterium intestinigallinarum]|nr:hypothetical protein [Candidatus Brevibacterium intestinigallinarum]
MNIGTRLILSAALAVGSTIGAAALGQTAVRDAQAEIAQAPTGSTTLTTTTAADVAEREAGVRSELLAAAEAGEISWAAAERVGEDLAGYIRGDRSAGVI